MNFQRQQTENEIAASCKLFSFNKDITFMGQQIILKFIALNFQRNGLVRDEWLIQLLLGYYCFPDLVHNLFNSFRCCWLAVLVSQWVIIMWSTVECLSLCKSTTSSNAKKRVITFMTQQEAVSCREKGLKTLWFFFTVRLLLFLLVKRKIFQGMWLGTFRESDFQKLLHLK